MNGCKRTPAQIQQRAQVCKELVLLCQEDSTVLEEIIDEYIYEISDNKVDQLEAICNPFITDDYRDLLLTSFRDNTY
tara:strand:+ start:478 stop:708 length:231 start_codon:yes stop_codon:yes gene_type:complete